MSSITQTPQTHYLLKVADKGPLHYFHVSGHSKQKVLCLVPSQLYQDASCKNQLFLSIRHKYGELKFKKQYMPYFNIITHEEKPQLSQSD